MGRTLLVVQFVACTLAVLGLTTPWPVGSFIGPVAIVAFILVWGISIAFAVRFGGLFWSAGESQLIMIVRHIARSKSPADITQLIVFVASLGGFIWLVASGWANASLSFDDGRHVLHGLGSPITLSASQVQLALFTAHILPVTLVPLGLCALEIVVLHATGSLTKKEFVELSREAGTRPGNTDASPGPMLIPGDR